jgi:hypothetical protein
MQEFKSMNDEANIMAMIGLMLNALQAPLEAGT